MNPSDQASLEKTVTMEELYALFRQIQQIGIRREAGIMYNEQDESESSGSDSFFTDEESSQVNLSVLQEAPNEILHQAVSAVIQEDESKVVAQVTDAEDLESDLSSDHFSSFSLDTSKNDSIPASESEGSFIFVSSSPSASSSGSRLPNPTEALQKADELLENNNFQEAKKEYLYYLRHSEIHNKNELLQIRKINEYLTENKLAEKEIDLSARINYRLSECYHRLGKNNVAKSYINLAIASNVGSYFLSSAYFLRAKINSKLNLPKEEDEDIKIFLDHVKQGHHSLSASPFSSRVSSLGHRSPSSSPAARDDELEDALESAFMGESSSAPMEYKEQEEDKKALEGDVSRRKDLERRNQELENRIQSLEARNQALESELSRVSNDLVQANKRLAGQELQKQANLRAQAGGSGKRHRLSSGH